MVTAIATPERVIPTRIARGILLWGAFILIVAALVLVLGSQFVLVAAISSAVYFILRKIRHDLQIRSR